MCSKKLKLEIMKKLFFVLFLLLAAFCFKANAQFSVTTYSTYALGISTNQGKKFSGELKTFLNRDIEDTIFELSGFYNFKARDYHRFSVGFGLSFVPFLFHRDIYADAILFPAQLEIFPLQNFKRFSLLVEVAPQYIFDPGLLNIQHLWGLRYTFGKKKNL